MAELGFKNLLVLLAVGFVSYLEWGIVMTSIFPYIISTSSHDHSQLYLSLAQSLFPLGQGLAQPIASTLVKRLGQAKVVVLGSMIMAIIGNVLYICAGKANSVVLIIIGRFVAGFGAGSGGVAYGLIGANTSQESRTKFMSFFRMSCMFGVLFSTIASATFLPGFGRTKFGHQTGLDEFLAPSALALVFLAVTLFMVIFMLNETHLTPVGEKEISLTTGRAIKSRGVQLGLLLFFLNGFITTWIGYVMPLIAYPIYKWSIPNFGWLMVGVSATAALGSFLAMFLTKAQCMKKNGDFQVLTACYVLMIIGIIGTYLGCPLVIKGAIGMKMEPVFITGSLLIFATYSVCGVILPCFTTKFVEKAMMPVIMPYTVAAMSVGKILAPLLCKAELAVQGWHLLFSVTIVFMVLGLVLFGIFYRAPHEENTPLISKTSQCRPGSDSCEV